MYCCTQKKHWVFFFLQFVLLKKIILLHIINNVETIFQTGNSAFFKWAYVLHPSTNIKTRDSLKLTEK